MRRPIYDIVRPKRNTRKGAEVANLSLGKVHTEYIACCQDIARSNGGYHSMIWSQQRTAQSAS